MIFTIDTPAADRNLVTLDEAKAALGIAGTDEDVALAALILRVSDMIAVACRVAVPSTEVPTLRREELTQTCRIEQSVSVLILARRFVSDVAIVEAGEELADTDFEVAGGPGLVRRLRSDSYTCWPACRKIVVSFKAGFEEVPEDLKLACITALREQRSASIQDPLLKRERVDDVGEQEFWVGGLTKPGAGPFSAVVSEMIGPYRTVSLT